MRRVKSISDSKKQLITLYLTVLGMYAIPALFSAPFRSVQNATNILNQAAPIGFVALGQTFPILIGGIDLSVGSVVSLTTALAAVYMATSGGIFTGVCLCLFAAAVVGLVNGLVINKLRVEPLIATLGTTGVVSGITLAIMPYPGGYVPSGFTNWWSYRVFGFFPLAFVYFLVGLLICHLILNFTRFGRRVYALGGDEHKASVAGIKVKRIKMGVYVLSSVFASIGGLALAARMRSGDPLAGNPFTLSSIAAVIVGGTSFTGGVGGVIGTAAGVAIMGLLSVILNIYGISPFFQNVLAGLIVVAAVVFNSIRSRSILQAKGRQ